MYERSDVCNAILQNNLVVMATRVTTHVKLHECDKDERERSFPDVVTRGHDGLSEASLFIICPQPVLLANHSHALSPASALLV